MSRACDICGISNSSGNVVLFDVAQRSPSVQLQWRSFVASPGREFPRKTHVHFCHYHFKDSCFMNKAKFDRGFAKQLKLYPDAIPTIRASEHPLDKLDPFTFISAQSSMRNWPSISSNEEQSSLDLDGCGVTTNDLYVESSDSLLGNCSSDASGPQRRIDDNIFKYEQKIITSVTHTKLVMKAEFEGYEDVNVFVTILLERYEHHKKCLANRNHCATQNSSNGPNKDSDVDTMSSIQENAIVYANLYNGSARDECNSKRHPCSQCDESFDIEEDLMDHKICKHPPLLCWICKKEFNSQKSFANHKRHSIPGYKFCCDICNETYCVQSQFSEHKRTKEHKAMVTGKLKKEKRKITLGTVSNLIQGAITNDYDKQYCMAESLHSSNGNGSDDYSNTTTVRIKQEESIREEVPTESPYPLVCVKTEPEDTDEAVNYSVSEPPMCIKTESSDIDEVEPYVIVEPPECEETEEDDVEPHVVTGCASPNDEWLHGDTNDISNDSNSDWKSKHSTGDLLKCNVCDKVFKKRYNLDVHVRLHSGYLPYQCDKCDLRFQRQQQLVAHRQKHDGNFMHSCSICARGFNYKQNLVNHMKQHTGERPFCCEECGKRFVLKAGLIQHSWVHKSVKPHSCGICGKMFGVAASYRAHMKTHIKDRPIFKCDACDKTFKFKKSLDRHTKTTHLGLKRFPCKECDKEFTSEHSLKIHYRGHSGERPFSCDICEMDFITNSHLKSHRRSEKHIKKVARTNLT